MSDNLFKYFHLLDDEKTKNMFVNAKYYIRRMN